MPLVYGQLYLLKVKDFLHTITKSVDFEERADRSTDGECLFIVPL